MRKVSRFRYGLLVVWPSLWINLASVLVGLLTLGYYVPMWEVNWLFWAGQKFSRATR